MRVTTSNPPSCTGLLRMEFLEVDPVGDDFGSVRRAGEKKKKKKITVGWISGLDGGARADDDRGVRRDPPAKSLQHHAAEKLSGIVPLHAEPCLCYEIRSSVNRRVSHGHHACRYK